MFFFIPCFKYAVSDFKGAPNGGNVAIGEKKGANLLIEYGQFLFVYIKFWFHLLAEF